MTQKLSNEGIDKENITKLSVSGLLVTLGIVYGDIGTSPLYVMKSVINGNGGLQNISENFILGTLSLVFWTITILTTIKYVLITLRADNKGEGGIFSLYALVRSRGRWLVIPAMIGGAALLADGMLTPAVTITSSIEGLRLVSGLHEFFSLNPNNIIIIVIAIIALIFLIQRSGTDLIGRFFGPVMLLWFLSLAFFGLLNISKDFTLLRALSPHYAIELLFSNENKLGFFILGSIFLATTGAEALYSDLGHVGRKNIYISWPFVKICLLLNYFGQGAWIIAQKNNGAVHNVAELNPFFQMVPDSMLLYAIIIATLAAIIASQALISGSFTLVSEAIQLNILPRLHIQYPSHSKGQLYIPSVNHILCVVCIGVVLYFRNSENMEAAYGLSITVTMLMTTILLFNYLRKKKTSLAISIIMLIFFMSFEASFFIANVIKFFHGGFIAVIIASAILYVMYIWNKSHHLNTRFRENVRIEDYKEQLNKLRQDATIPKYSTNLVCLTSCTKKYEIDRKIMYFLLDKRAKKADVYWFVNIMVTDEPYQAEYTVDTFNTSYIVKVQLYLGFRVEQQLNVFLRQISSDLVKNGEINLQPSAYTTMPGRNLGDFRFVIIQEVLSYQSSASVWDAFILRSKLLIKKFTVSPSTWFGLDTSDVYVEKVPLFIGRPERTVLKRIKKE
jgi:KUP system potassium uptake protein